MNNKFSKHYVTLNNMIEFQKEWGVFTNEREPIICIKSRLVLFLVSVYIESNLFNNKSKSNKTEDEYRHGWKYTRI